MSDEFDVDALLEGIMMPERPTLKGLFEKKLKELDMSATTAYEVMGMNYRAVNKILSGSQKLLDISSIPNLAAFLEISEEEVIKLCLDAVKKNAPTSASISSKKIKLIKESFDLVVLKKAGVIDSLKDFEHIEKRLNARLGLKSILEYRKPTVDIAFSSGSFKPENDRNRAFWVKAAIACFEEINNPNEYSKAGLIDLFPRIRWYTMNVERGLTEVIRQLYKIGITVVFQPPLLTLQLRGATFSHNNKPCIVLSDYVGFYPTLWFALVHELSHVLFDWEEIKEGKYHLSDDKNETLTVREHEKEANRFTRNYLFSIEKTNKIRPYLNDARYVEEFARDNHVHPSFIYVFNAFDVGETDRMAWARARRLAPTTLTKQALKVIDLPWEEENPAVEDILHKYKSGVYN